MGDVGPHDQIQLGTIILREAEHRPRIQNNAKRRPWCGHLLRTFWIPNRLYIAERMQEV